MVVKASNSKTLIVPDVHERLYVFKQVEALRDVVTRIVWLGDFHDSFRFDDPQHTKNVVNEVKRVIAAGDDVLLGNHDCHYYFDNEAFGCSGFKPHKRSVIKDMMTREEIDFCRIYAFVGPYVVSHAGFHPKTQKWMDPFEEEEAIVAALDGKFHPLFSAGRGRCGHSVVGGPTWLDWNDEFEHIDNKPQIVGHTVGSAVRTKGMGQGAYMSWCIDTASKNMAVVDEESGKVEIIEAAQ